MNWDKFLHPKHKFTSGFATLILTFVLFYFFALLKPHEIFCYTLSPSQGARFQGECGGTYMLVLFLSLFISGIIILTFLYYHEEI